MTNTLIMPQPVPVVLQVEQYHAQVQHLQLGFKAQNGTYCCHAYLAGRTVAYNLQYMVY